MAGQGLVAGAGHPDVVLLELPCGESMACPAAAVAEAEQLYEEVVADGCYWRHGLDVGTGAYVVDVGANLGLFGLSCMRRAKQLQLVAIEPVPSTHTVCVANVANWSKRYGAKSSTVLQLAAGGLTHEEWTDFATYTRSPGENTRHPGERAMLRAALRTELQHWVVSAGSSTMDPLLPAVRAELEVLNTESVGSEACVGIVRCPVVSLEQVLQDHRPSGTIDLIKIDVEGDEESVLDGLSEATWPRVRQLVAEVHNVRGRLKRVQRKLESVGFTVHTEAQVTRTHQSGYISIVPARLQLYCVYATRRRRSQRNLKPRAKAQRDSVGSPKGRVHAQKIRASPRSKSHKRL